MRIAKIKIEDAILLHFKGRAADGVVMQKTGKDKLLWDALVQIQVFERLFDEIEESMVDNNLALVNIIAEKNRYEV